jgi:hypothetical protein
LLVTRSTKIVAVPIPVVSAIQNFDGAANNMSTAHAGERRNPLSRMDRDAID